MNDKTMATMLGLASIGIGLAEIGAPKQLQKAFGISDSDGDRIGVLRVLGAREIMHGIDILGRKDKAAGIWSRVAGDVLDTAVLAVAARKTKSPARFAAMSALVVGIGIMDLVCAKRLAKRKA